MSKIVISSEVQPCQAGATKMCSAQKWCEDFPIFKQTMHGKPLVYLDSSSTTQKPQVVIDAICHFYSQDNANVHRGVYSLSERATRAFEATRVTVQRFIHAKHAHEIVFTKGTTEAINLLASSFGQTMVAAGDEILISAMEHHSNIVPWQVLCKQKGATLRVIPVLDDGSLDLAALPQLLTKRTKLLALLHVSNVLGTVNSVQEIIKMAHANQTPVLLDGAQAAAHLSVDVQALDCDFYTFSGHKLYGPMGIGVLYGKTKWLEQMPPYQTGGGMVSSVNFEKTEYGVLPNKFEAGTPDVAAAVGLGAAINYLQHIGMDTIIKMKKKLTAYAAAALASIPGLTMIGTTPDKIGVFSFMLDSIHPHDIATILDMEGIAVRAGHHCAMPLMERFNVPALARVSLGLYNQPQDIDQLIEGLQKAICLFKDKTKQK